MFLQVEISQFEGCISLMANVLNVVHDRFVVHHYVGVIDPYFGTVRGL